jgi:ribosome-binding protein aMBF1 (putative translation factor)
VIYCDLCGKPSQCTKKEIDGKEFDLCNSCWKPLAEKLNGKGRAPDALQHREEEQELEEYDEISIS